MLKFNFYNLDTMEGESSDELCTPPEMKSIALKTTENLLPSNSKEKYQAIYETFDKWRAENKAPISENVLLAYFDHLKQTNKPNSLWAIFSMLKSTLKLYNQIDIGMYAKLVAFLKRNSEHYVPKKAKILTNENIQKFLNEAPDNSFLAMKVSLITAHIFPYYI